MTKKVWIVWALCLMLPGGLGLSIYALQVSDFQERLTQARLATSKDTAIKDYMQMYEQWYALDPEDKADMPWGLGEYGGKNIRQELEKGQEDRLMLDMNQLSKGINHYPDVLAEMIYGPGWELKIEDYQRHRGRAEMLLTASTFLAATGGLVLIGGLIKNFISLMIRKKQVRDEKNDTDGVAPQDTIADPGLEKKFKTKDTDPDAETPPDSDTDAEILEENPETPSEKRVLGYFGTHKKSAGLGPSEKSSRLSSLPPAAGMSGTQSLLKETTKDSYFGWAVEDDAPAIDKLMTSEPLTRELSELTEEVSAIRQFAAQQQDQVRKLQDGYDWMIIRRFCQRIIRCVDNIEDRLIRLRQDGDASADPLQDIHDELVFALESSGAEQYTPELNVPFKGLEKYVEAVRDRTATDDETLSGTIAEIIRPGYQYLVNDDEVKIIRCAQVKLYEIPKPS